MMTRTRMNRASSDNGLADEAGVRAAYQAHGAELYRFARRALGDDGLAQDAVQETFLRAWRAAERFDPDLSSLRVWLFAITRNVVVDLARRRAAGSWAAVPGEADLIDRALRPVPDQTDRILATWLVEEALGRLSAEHRYVIVETYIKGRSYEEVAGERGVPVGTLRSRTFYALKALRIAMDEMGVTL
jgi:RNA polymerase sigma-70 factor, ECF subfamily